MYIGMFIWREELTSATAYIYVPWYQLQCGPHKCHVEVKNGIMVAGGRIDLLMNYVEVPFLYQINVLFLVKSNGSFFYEINWLIFSERMVTRLVPFLFIEKDYK
jgi:hypothetical protein